MDEDLLAWMKDREKRDQILLEFNASTMDPVGPVGSQDQQMRVLGEMNELSRAQGQLIRKGVPSTDVL